MRLTAPLSVTTATERPATVSLSPDDAYRDPTPDHRLPDAAIVDTGSRIMYGIAEAVRLRRCVLDLYVLQ
jgi:hypothetical protein